MASPSGKNSAPRDLAHLAVWLLFFVSGACGLIYQVLWCRQLGLIFGNTVQSLSAVLTAFMGGLALGSYIAGKYSHRLKRPLLVYGVLELLIGLYCAALPWVFSDASPLIPFYRGLYGEDGGQGLIVARFVISCLLLLIPATCMGATLPVLSQYMVRGPKALGKIVGALYAINALGAVAGAILTGFYLLPVLGKLETNQIAVICNVVLGVAAIVLGRHTVLTVEEIPLSIADQAKNMLAEQTLVSPFGLKCAIWSFGITGFAAMATQIAWTRAISLGTGSSSYAFSLIVAIFIFGLSLGGFWGSRLAARNEDPIYMLSKIQLMIGIFGLAISVMLGFGPVLFFIVMAFGKAGGWNGMLLAQTLLIGALIVWPTILMGATMPLTLQAAARAGENAGKTVGRIYAVNTLGSILGSFLGGIVLLPLLQVQETLGLMAMLYALPAMVLYYVSTKPKNTSEQSFFRWGVAILLLTLVFSPRWNPNLMSSGLYLLRDEKSVEKIREFRFAEAIPDFDAVRKILFYREGLSCTVAVAKMGDEISLSVGGKPDASSIGDMSTQVGLTMVPLSIHAGKPEDVLVIGLGSGVSAGCALAPSTVKRVDVVEMSPEVVEGAKFFTDYNFLDYSDGPHPWPRNPKLNIIINDGRNHLLLTSRKYDVIASEPSNPWIAGIGNLFTREAFTLCKQRLKPGGIMAQWIHSYSLDQAHFYSIVKTFGEVFPAMQLWTVNQYDFLLVGSDGEIRVPYELLTERLNEPGVKKIMQRVHFDTPEELLACYQASATELKLASSFATLHTDDNMMLEFSAPRGLYFSKQPFQSWRFSSGAEQAVNSEALPPKDHAEFLSRLDLSLVARENFRCSIEFPRLLDPHMRHAAAIAPHQHWAQEYQNNKTYFQAERLLQGLPIEKTKTQAGAALDLLLPLEPDAAYQHFDAALLEHAWQLLPAEVERLLKEHKPDEALALIERFSHSAYQGRLLLLKARVLAQKKEFENALKTLSEAAAAGASPLECTRWAVEFLRDSGRPQDALATLGPNLSRLEARDDPETYPLWALRAELLEQAGQFQTALDSIRLAARSPGYRREPVDYKNISLDPQYLNLYEPAYPKLEAQLHAKLGHPLEALFCFHWATTSDPNDTDIRLQYAQTLLAAARNPATPTAFQPASALDLARLARRNASALLKESPGKPGLSELLAQCYDRLAELDSTSALFYKSAAQFARAH